MRTALDVPQNLWPEIKVTVFKAFFACLYKRFTNGISGLHRQLNMLFFFNFLNFYLTNSYLIYWLPSRSSGRKRSSFFQTNCLICNSQWSRGDWITAVQQKWHRLRWNPLQTICSADEEIIIVKCRIECDLNGIIFW